MIEVILKSGPLHYRGLASEDLDSFIQDGLNWRILNRPRAWRPPMDIYETDEALIIRIEIGGMKESDFHISLNGRQLTIDGIRSDISERRAYHQMEIPFGEFIIQIELPVAIDENHVEALYLEGFLRIVMAKARSHHIRIED